MRRITWILAFVLIGSMVLAGCGAKGADDVVKDLDAVVGKLESYEGAGRMILHTGQEAQEYDVEVWYKNPHYYRISLKNAKKDITQIVLRNDEGVFVLTPHLNKMFRFQSDWPENSGQVYLFQSLAQSIVMDQERQFTTDKDAYVFDVVANYQNGSLARQKIWLNKRSYAPQHVEVSDEGSNVLVVMDFSHFEFGKKFEKDSFDMQRNMTSWKLETLPAMAQAGGGEAAGVQAAPTGTAAEPGQTAPTGGAASGGGQPEAQAGAAGAPQPGTAAKQQSFGVIEPLYTPEGVKHLDLAEVTLGENKGVVLRYAGKYNYSLLETRPQAQAVTGQTGKIMDLGFTLGVLLGDEMKTLTWMHDGVEFRMSTTDLPEAEMVLIAQSVQGAMGK